MSENASADFLQNIPLVLEKKGSFEIPCLLLLVKHDHACHGRDIYSSI